jgi:hypothetical protein
LEAGALPRAAFLPGPEVPWGFIIQHSNSEIPIQFQ